MLYPQLPGVAFFPMAHLPQLILLTGSVNLCPNFLREKKHVPFTNPRISKVDPVMESKTYGRNISWLVVSTPLKDDGVSSVGTIIPIYYGKNNPNVPNQPTRSYVFPMVFLWFSYGFPIILWFSYGFYQELWKHPFDQASAANSHGVSFDGSDSHAHPSGEAWWNVGDIMGKEWKRWEKNMKLKCWTKHSWWMLSRSIPGFWMVDIPLRNG